MVEDGEAAVVGEFARAVERAQSRSSEAMRTVSEPYANRMVGGMISELFALCDLTLDMSDLTKGGKRDGPPRAP